MISRTCSGSLILDSILKESQQSKEAELKHNELDPSDLAIEIHHEISKKLNTKAKNLESEIKEMYKLLLKKYSPRERSEIGRAMEEVLPDEMKDASIIDLVLLSTM